MSPVFAYQCCGCYLEQIEGGTMQDHQNAPPLCRVCGQWMSRVISTPTIRVKGYNAANGYSSTPSGPSTKFGS